MPGLIFSEQIIKKSATFSLSASRINYRVAHSHMTLNVQGNRFTQTDKIGTFGVHEKLHVDVLTIYYICAPTQHTWSSFTPKFL